MFKSLPPKTLFIIGVLLVGVMIVSYIANNYTGSGRVLNAVRSGDLETVRSILEKNPALVDHRDSHHRGPLIYWAAMKGNAEMCRLLIEKDADFNLGDKYGITALHKAAVFNHIDALRVLLDRYADTESKGFKYGHRWVTPLHLAAEAGNVEAAALLLQRGADINASEDGVAPTPLHLAAARGYYDMVKLLLDNGARINARDWNDKTPLQWARTTDKDEIIKLLRDRGAFL